MEQSLVELSKDLTLALVETGRVLPEDMQNTLQKTYATLTALKAQEERGGAITMPSAMTPDVNWRKSITKYMVICLECGQRFKQLSGRHLRTHDLDSRSYRVKYGIPQEQALAARDTTARRRQIVQEIRPWEKTKTFRKGQVREGMKESESSAETAPDETKTPDAKSPAQQTGQQKTIQKKKTARKKRAAE